MTEDVADLFKMGVEMSLTAVVLVGVLVLVTISQNIGSTLSEQKVVTDRMREYREYNQFDNNVVYPADIISIIYQYRGLPYVYVEYDSTKLIWSSSSISRYPTAVKQSDYRATAIASVIDQTRFYRASLIYGGNGEVEGISFISE